MDKLVVMPETPHDHWEYTLKEWNTPLFRRITDELPKKIGVLYDIGANVGGFAQVMKDKYPDLQAVCFEPVKENFVALEEYVPWAECINYGIYYGKHESRVTWRGSNIGAYFVEHINSGEPRVFTGEVMKLEELETFDKLPLPDLIKLDVEGAEENILEYSETCRNCPWLIIEWHPDHVNPYEFFKKYLPRHKIVVDLESKQFLLKI